MRFLHTSDWHLGASESSSELREDQIFFIDEICRLIREESIDAVLLSGDVYDRAVASAEAIRLYDYAMTRICRELGKQVFSIAGNHDGADRLSACRELLASSGLHVCGALEREPAVIDCGDSEIYLLPWISEEKVKSIFPEERDNIGCLEDAYRAVANRLRESFNEGKRHIIVSHAFVRGGFSSESDRAASIGTAEQISAEVFEGFDYAALGHLHGYQEVGTNAAYSGTPMPYSFGREEMQEKGVIIIDTEDMSRRFVALPLLHKRRTLTGTLEELLTMELPEDIKNGYVRLLMTDCYLSREAIAMLRAVYPHALDVGGREFDGESSGISLTIGELEQLEADPLKVFSRFCEDNNEEATAHRLELFSAAINSVEEGGE